MKIGLRLKADALDFVCVCFVFYFKLSFFLCVVYNERRNNDMQIV